MYLVWIFLEVMFLDCFCSHPKKCCIFSLLFVIVCFHILRFVSWNVRTYNVFSPDWFFFFFAFPVAKTKGIWWWRLCWKEYKIGDMKGKLAFDLKLLTEFKKHIQVMPLTILCFGYRGKSAKWKLSWSMSCLWTASLFGVFASSQQRLAACFHPTLNFLLFKSKSRSSEVLYTKNKCFYKKVFKPS